MQIDKFYTFVNEWNFDRMASRVNLKRTIITFFCKDFAFFIVSFLFTLESNFTFLTFQKRVNIKIWHFRMTCMFKMTKNVQSKSLLLIMEYCLPFTYEVMVDLLFLYIDMCNRHTLALHLETFGYNPHFLSALNVSVFFLSIGEKRGDSLMVGSLFQKMLIELGTKYAECNLMLFHLLSYSLYREL